jgi:fumarate hydratase class II
MMPIMAAVILESIELLANSVDTLTEKCLVHMEVNADVCEAMVERSLAMATGLNPYIGYERAAAVAKEAYTTGKTIREICLEQKILPEDQLKQALDPWRMTHPQEK